MIKVIPPGSFDFGEEAARMIKISSDGLRGHDLSTFVKRAGHELADRVQKMAFAKGEIPIHLLAMGAVEGTGANRNADGWEGRTLENDHPSFQKYARWYAEHANKDPRRSYGIVKDSYYNRPMQRVELIAALNGTKEAAERNQGLVAATEMDMLERGDDIPVSMSTKCAYDVCSGCGNRAKTRMQYCTGHTCKYGGLQKNAGRVFEDGHQLYANTFGNKFFDISRVGRPADHTAYVFGKIAAGQDKIITGAELAEIMHIQAPANLLVEDAIIPGTGPDILGRIKMARELYNSYTSTHQMPFAALVRFPVEVLQGSAVESLTALAQEKIALTLPDWLQVCTGLTHEKCAATASTVLPHLINVISDLIGSDELPDVLRAGMLPKAAYDIQLCKQAVAQRDIYALTNDSIQRRAQLAALRSESYPILQKVAGAPSDAVREIAKHYFAYQVEFAYNFEKDASVADIRKWLVVQTYLTV